MVTKETVDQLIETGFTELRAHKALVKTSNAGIEGAINWLTEHLEDADIDEPIEGEGEGLVDHRGRVIRHHFYDARPIAADVDLPDQRDVDTRFARLTADLLNTRTR